MPAPTSVTETIAAISTPPGRGGIGIVRLSGPEAAAIAVKLVRLRGWLSTHMRAWPMCSMPRATKPRASTKPW